MERTHKFNYFQGFKSTPYPKSSAPWWCSTKGFTLNIFCLDTFCIGVLLCCVASRNSPLPIRGGRTCQKRAFRIILPSVHYKYALRTLDCLTLAERRENLCLRTVKNIYKQGGCLSRHLPLDKTHSYNTAEEL